MTDVALPRVPRPAYFDGERLLAETLDEAFAGPLALHRLHNRALHGWGIAFGLDVTGARGAKTVNVSAGYAIDCGGRDLVLPAAVDLGVPPVSAAPDCSPVPFALVISYTEDADADVETLAGVCGARGAVRRSDLPSVRFLPPQSVRAGLDVVLATVKVLNCALADRRDATMRRAALPAGRPYVAVGATPTGSTQWRPWPASGSQAGVVTTVVTSAAGFGDPPRYEARVEGPRLVPRAQSPTGEPCLVDGTLAVEAATAGSFDAVMLLPQGFSAGPAGGGVLTVNPPEALDASFLRELGWRVVWVGVEGS
jgi:hypothetical protein